MTPITRARIAALVALFLSAGPAAAQTCPAPPDGETTAPLHARALRYLADDALEGRLAGSPGERCAGDFIASVFRQLGLEPAGENGTFFQELSLASTLNPHAPGGTGRNVIARIDGSDPQLAREIIVIGAHYDHLGRGAPGSLAPDQPGSIHNGADDNASGVAAMLRVAARLAACPAPARSVLFIAFTGEESGLLGSAWFMNHPTIGSDTIVAMLNMDMVGRLGAGPLIVYGVDTAAEWRSLLESAGQRAGVELAFRGEGYGPSDHTSFYARDIPVLHFFTNTHGDYHRPSDDADKIDYDGLARVASIVENVATRIADRRPRLTLQRGAGEPPRPAGEASPGYGAWLGTVPDFTPVERGVKLSGVTPGSPAANAGIAAGDIIVGLGRFDVPDLQAMTDALRAHKPGDEVEVRFIRAGETKTVKAVLGNRANR